MNKEKNDLARVEAMGDGSDSPTASEVQAGSEEPITPPTQKRNEDAAEWAGYPLTWGDEG